MCFLALLFDFGEILFKTHFYFLSVFFDGIDKGLSFLFFQFNEHFLLLVLDPGLVFILELAVDDLC